MIGIKTPFRISFFGGGSDLKSFYSKNNGSVISTSINKYMYIFVNKFFTNQIQIKYSKTELASNFKDIKHPIVREILKKFQLSGVDINSIADIPAGTGLGSSSAFTVALLNALYVYQNRTISKKQLAKEASEIEIDLLGEPIGKQDQYASAYGGLNRINFLKDGGVEVNKIELSKDEKMKFQENLVLMYYGNQRDASDILSEQNKKIKTDHTTQDTLVEMVRLVDEAEDYIIRKDFDSFGRLLNNTWKLKKSLASNVSNTEIDDIYDLAMNAGAFGGKLLGAGSGGFFLFYVPISLRENVTKKLSKLKEFKFQFEELGSTTIMR